MRFNDEPYGSKQCMGPVPAAAPLLAGLGTAGAGLGTLGSIASLIGTVGGAVSAIKGLKGPKSPSAPAAPVSPVEAPKPITKPFAQARPDSLSTLAGYAPDQERTFLATKGTQGGLGKEEDSYYKNLIQRSLIGDDNRPVSGGVDDYLKPVESQYFSRAGANTGGIEDFLRSIRGY